VQELFCAGGAWRQRRHDFGGRWLVFGIVVLGVGVAPSIVVVVAA
jgi:hypothetical protein